MSVLSVITLSLCILDEGKFFDLFDLERILFIVSHVFLMLCLNLLKHAS